jgi:hypothetical protein
MSVRISSFIGINYLKQNYRMHFHCCTQRHFESTCTITGTNTLREHEPYQP